MSAGHLVSQSYIGRFGSQHHIGRFGRKSYIGRFAPSPSGPLHMGSLVCALASYLDAKAHNGTWLIRIEDIDSQREQPGASQTILECLNHHQLVSDGEIIFQSNRSRAYDTALEQLTSRGLSYYCQCTRKRLKALDGTYDGHCRTKAHTEGALRFNLQAAMANGINVDVNTPDRFSRPLKFDDRILQSDFIIHRKDGFYAYQLAVVVDDIEQKISHVVRGDDLLDTTYHQRVLFSAFGVNPPCYGHIPVVLAGDGRKLSKQNGAPAIDNRTPENNVRIALQYLGLNLISGYSTADLLALAVNWWREKLALQP